LTSSSQSKPGGIGGSPPRYSQNPMKGGGKSPNNVASGVTATTLLSSKKKRKEAETSVDIKLEDPTSVQLMNSYLIQKSGSTFDNYLNVIRAKRKSSAPKPLNLTMSNTTGPRPFDETNQKNCYGKVQYRRPQARDGHTGVIFEDNLIIFGGDRHHMPFNDLYFLRLGRQL
jgi:hypothetical protein